MGGKPKKDIKWVQLNDHETNRKATIIKGIFFTHKGKTSSTNRDSPATKCLAW